jgi:transposase
MTYLYIMLPALEHLSKNELIRAIEKLENKNQYLVQEILHLRAKVARYEHMNFAQKRERFIDPNQATLPFELPEEEKQKLEAQTTEKISYERKKPAASKHAGRQPLPEHLPVEEVHIQPEEDTTGMVCIGTEVTDELEYKPASYFIRRYIRYKYARKDKEKVVIGALPSRVIDKGIAGPGVNSCDVDPPFLHVDPALNGSIKVRA